MVLPTEQKSIIRQGRFVAVVEQDHSKIMPEYNTEKDSKALQQ